MSSTRHFNVPYHKYCRWQLTNNTAKQNTLRALLVYTLLACALLVSLCVKASETDYYFRNHDIRNGLTQNTVTCMRQDRQGFMWFGTHDGLNRYDGVAFRRVSPADNAKGCSMVSCLFEAWDGKIWVGATDGLYVYDPALERMSRMDITTPDGYTVRGNVAIITQDSKGQILISSDDNGVYRYDKNTGKFKLLRGERDMNCGKVNSLLFDSNGRLWVGFFGNGLFYSDDDLRTLHRVKGGNGESYLTNTIVNDLMLNAGNIYVATDTEGMHRVNLISLKGSCVMKQVDGMVPIMRKLMMHDNQIWIGSENGVYIYDIVRGDVVEHLTHVYNDQYSISDNAV